jgi:phage tail-like protein
LTEPTIVRLPALTGPEPPPTPSGWMALQIQATALGAPLVAVPSRDDARRCALAGLPSVVSACAVQMASINSSSWSSLIGANGITLTADVAPSALVDQYPVLTLTPVGGGGITLMVTGEVGGIGNDRLMFTIPSTADDGVYELSVSVYVAPAAQLTLSHAPTIVSFDPPDGTTLIAVNLATKATVQIGVAPWAIPGETPVLSLTPVAGGPATTFTGRVEGLCNERLVFTGVVAPDGAYELSVAGYIGATAQLTFALTTTPPPQVVVNSCAITLAAGAAPVGVALTSVPTVWPQPPLIAVDKDGCVVAGWSVNTHGWVLGPGPKGCVYLLQSFRGGIRAVLRPTAAAGFFVDAIFWQDVIAAVTPTALFLFDLRGCLIAQASYPFVAAVALAISDEGFLVVIDRSSRPNVTFLRRDLSRVLGPASFDGRGWYARHRSPVFAISASQGTYCLIPANAIPGHPLQGCGDTPLPVDGTDCCVASPSALTDTQALLFDLIDDLPDLRQRVAYPLSGQVVLGPAQPTDALDAGRPGTQWHRIRIFGTIPSGCSVGVQTRAFDDVLAGDPLLAGNWFPASPVFADENSAVPVAAPADERIAAGDFLVLAGPGQFLWIQLTLGSNGNATPAITSIEVVQPRAGTSRFLPKVFRDSTPEDDFLRRWLALFETTAWNGIAGRMDAYSALFDPRTAPVQMLPYLAGWLQVPLFSQIEADTTRLRRILVNVPDRYAADGTLIPGLASSRGTIYGLELIASLYLDMTIQVVESYVLRSRFILGTGSTVGTTTGPALGCDTVLTVEPSPTYLDDEPTLGSSYLLNCETRDGAIAYEFDVLVPARQVCLSQNLNLLESLLDAEKPAHTSYTIRVTAPAGWVLGAASVVGQEVGPTFDRTTLDPSTYGIALLNGPPRPIPIGLGFQLGFDSRLAASAGPPVFRLDATVGSTTRLGA